MIRGPSFCGTGGAFIGRRMACSPYDGHIEPGGASESRMIFAAHCRSPAKTSVDCRAKSMKRSLGGSRNTNLSRPSPSHRRPERRNVLRSLCAAAPHMHIGFEGCSAHLLRPKSTFQHVFWRATRACRWLWPRDLKPWRSLAPALPRHLAGQESPCARPHRPWAAREQFQARRPDWRQ